MTETSAICRDLTGNSAK